MKKLVLLGLVCAIVATFTATYSSVHVNSATSSSDLLHKVFLPIVAKNFCPSVEPCEPFYKLRLHITTTSDWSWVGLTDGARVLVGAIVETNGGFPRDGGDRIVGLGQAIGAALRGEQVSVMKDLALTDLSDQVEFEITRGDLGETIVEVWNANGEVPINVSTVRWSGLNPPFNAFSFTVDAHLVTGGGPLTHGLDEIKDAAEEAFSLARQLNNQLPELQPLFHRASITFTTTSDWANVSIAHGAEIYGVRLLDTIGNPTHAEASRINFALNQPLEQANAGSTVGLTADMALADVVQRGDVEFVISKGHLNDATVEVFNHNTADAVSIRRVTHSGVASISDPRNPLTFTVEAEALTANGSLEAPKPIVDKMVWAFYYLWYHLGDWASPILKDRPATRYASSDPQALARHIEQAQSAGIDGFIASWWGPGDQTDYNLKLLLDAAAMRGFAVTAYFETLYAEGWHAVGPRDEQQITEWLEYLIREYGQHPGYYRLNGKPVIVVWASNSVPLATWQRIFTNLRTRGLDAFYIAMGYNPEVLSEFEGLHEYGVNGHYRLGALYQHAAQLVRSSSLLYPDAAPKIWIATLQPGYDERTIPGRQGYYWERRNGDSYRYTFEAAMKSDPDWLFITTWNEWWEHTYIEPSEQYGDLYLRLTKEFANAWKKR